MTTSPNPYDELPYNSYPLAQTHPDRLAMVATLFGMTPTPLEDCSVLEIGCAAGGNLIPLAAALPTSRFIGIDLSQAQIAAGRETLSALKLANVRLESLDLQNVSADLGRFDYIICHGVYSWVDAPARARILESCEDLLNPQGVAYVSYNTLPGWRARGVLRDLLSYRARGAASTAERVEQAKELLKSLAESIGPERSVYGAGLKSEIEALRARNDSYLLHEHLAPLNEPLYFHQFASAAAEHGLQFLAEADLGIAAHDGLASNLEPVVRKLASDLLEWEQYQDFVRNRSFRQTLLCRADVTLDRASVVERVARLFVGSSLRPEPGGDLDSLSPLKFSGAAGSIATSSPLLKNTLATLGARWPVAAAVESVVDDVLRRFARGPDHAADEQRDRRSLLASLLDCHARKLIELRFAPPHCQRQVSEHPLAFAVARHQAAAGRTVANLLHGVVVLNELQRQLLLLADGAHSETDMVNALGEFVASGDLTIKTPSGEVVNSPEGGHDVRAILGEAVRWNLELLAHEALLIG